MGAKTIAFDRKFLYHSTIKCKMCFFMVIEDYFFYSSIIVDCVLYLVVTYVMFHTLWVGS